MGEAKRRRLFFELVEGFDELKKIRAEYKAQQNIKLKPTLLATSEEIASHGLELRKKPYRLVEKLTGKELNFAESKEE